MRRPCSLPSVTRLVLTPLIVDGAHGVAFEVGVQDVAIEPANDKFKPARQHLHVYGKQADGTWKIAAAMSGNQ
jgi:ketosteroid isomerase-like protein